MTRLTTWTPRTDGMTRGVWCLLGANTAEALSFSEFDFIGIDAQHGLFDDAAIRETMHVIPASRKDVIARVPRNDPALIGRALDAGVRGVIVPMVETAEDAAAAASAARYPAIGSRSWGQMAPHWGGTEISVDEANARTVLSVMVENTRGLENVEAIAATPGVDMIYVGPFDLSIALGTTVDRLLSEGADGPLGRIARVCKDNDVIPGAFAGTQERAEVLAGLGFEVIATATDTALLQNAGSTRSGSGQGYS